MSAHFDHLIPPAELFPECFASFVHVTDEKHRCIDYVAMVFQCLWVDFGHCNNFTFGLN